MSSGHWGAMGGVGAREGQDQLWMQKDPVGLAGRDWGDVAGGQVRQDEA